MWANNLRGWTRAVLKKNGGKCVRCGAPAEDAHHVFPKAKFPELALLIENGAPMCKACHKPIQVYRSRDYYLNRAFRKRLQELCQVAGIKTIKKGPQAERWVKPTEKGLPLGLFLLYLTDIGGKQKWRALIEKGIKEPQSG